MNRKQKPAQLSDLVSSFLKEKGLEKRVEQAQVIPEWPTLVGNQIAGVTEPLFVSADGTLFIAVKTSAWMNELSLMEPELIRALNSTSGRTPVRKIRFRIMQENGKFMHGENHKTDRK